MPQAPPLQGGEGSIWVLLSPQGPAPRGTEPLCFHVASMRALTGSHAWSPGQEARNPGPGNDPGTSAKSLPTCCSAFSTLLSKPPSEDFPQCL